VRVYNLQTDEPHTFFASGAAVHNKGGAAGRRFGGGGFHSGGHSGGGNADPVTVLVLFGVIAVILVVSRIHEHSLTAARISTFVSPATRSRANWQRRRSSSLHQQGGRRMDRAQPAGADRESLPPAAAMLGAREYAPMEPLLMPISTPNTSPS